MKTHADYRKLAEDCVRLARTASTPWRRSTLLNIAHTWLQLADRADGDQASGVEDRIMRNGERSA
jgi:hypothetical protein